MGEKSTDIPLPKAWPEHARSAIVHVIAMARTAIVYARGKAAKMPVPGASLRAKLDNARAEIAQPRALLLCVVAVNVESCLHTDRCATPCS